MPRRQDRGSPTSRTGRSGVALGAVLSLLCGSPAKQVWSATPAEAGATHKVIIESLQFTPRSLSVRVGERVIWVNEDLVPHTVTAQDKTFDSGNLAPEASWSFSAAHKGEFHYVCSFHPTMTATLIVN